MSSNLYELLQRHPHLLNSNTLVLGAAAELPPTWQESVRTQGLQILSWDLQTCQSYAPLSAPQITHALPDSQHLTADKSIILLWPKAKPLALALLSKIAEQHSNCYVVGTNDAGGKSIHKAAHELIHSATKLDSARHCSLWQLELKPQASTNWLKLAKSFNYLNHAYLTLPGVFNHGALDTGTAVLLEYLPAPREGKLLDLGCGSGVIGLSMKAREPSLEVVLADVDALALQSTGLNAARLGLDVEIVASNGLNQIDGRFDYIVTNPPFHQGKDTNYSFAKTLFMQAKQHLSTDGQLWLVANRHLNYEDWAREHFASVQIMAQEQGFKLLCLA